MDPRTKGTSVTLLEDKILEFELMICRVVTLRPLDGGGSIFF